MINTTILLVDDEPELLEILADQLSTRFEKTLMALDGRRALEILKTEKVDFVITDYRMPVMNGLTLMKEMRKIRPLMPVLMLTGNDHEPELLQSLPAGGFDFLEKPFRFEILINRIRNGMATARLAETMSEILKKTNPQKAEEIRNLPWIEQIQALEDALRTGYELRP